ncbi:hypothetical protein QE152_g39666 [Popillia japonica]|uniref:Uncharacterized protein n=1 Tax=Popillia japonica TaxID=7064 RepID=A0AAW1HTK7_POPJA
MKRKYTIQELSPFPQAVPTASKKILRKPSKKGHINTTPDIEELKKDVDEKTRKERKKLARKVNQKIIIEEEKDNFDEDEDTGRLYCNDLYSRSKYNESGLNVKNAAPGATVSVRRLTNE